MEGKEVLIHSNIPAADTNYYNMNTFTYNWQNK